MLAVLQQKQVEPLQRELAEIVAARRAIRETTHEAVPSTLDDDLDRYKRMKYEDLATMALKRAFPNGGTINEILDYIRTEFGREIAQGSFSPILSRLRQKGSLTKDGHAWVLRDTE